MKEKLKFEKYFLLLIRVLLIISSFYYIFIQKYSVLIELGIIFLLSFLPFLIDKFFKFKLSKVALVSYIFITFSSIYFGRELNFYNNVWWFDILQHLIAGIMYMDLGFHISIKSKINVKKSIIFGIFFSIAMLAFWEIVEFCTDYFFNTNNQRWKFDINSYKNRKIGSTKIPEGLIDTMTDIIAGSISTIIWSLKFYFSKKTKYK